MVHRQSGLHRCKNPRFKNPSSSTAVVSRENGTHAKGNYRLDALQVYACIDVGYRTRESATDGRDGEVNTIVVVYIGWCQDMLRRICVKYMQCARR